MKIPKLINSHEIILVDDDEAESLIMQRFLEKSNLPNPLLSFRSGPDFLKYMEEVQAQKQRMPAVVLLDIRMPMMDGFEVLKVVRQEEKFFEIPIIVMFSNSDAPPDIQKAYALGANGYQSKPSGEKEFTKFFQSLQSDAA